MKITPSAQRLNALGRTSRGEQLSQEFTFFRFAVSLEPRDTSNQKISKTDLKPE